MPRRARIDAPGALHHIMVRGIERRRIFRDDEDRNGFVDRLGRVLEESSTACYAWVLMPNHVHLLLRTGTVPIAAVMRRLLTGYAGGFNRRHRRHGQLFQNRYKSILCQDDPYLLELTRYIHLNPLRGKVVRDLEELDGYAYCGHASLMGRREVKWQDVDDVLSLFGGHVGVARGRYRAFMEEGLDMGRRPELVGGGLIRSLGGWASVKAMRKGDVRIKGDERMLGDGDFVMEVLERAEEHLRRAYRLEREGYDLGKVASRVASVLGMEPEEIFTPGRTRQIVTARGLYCFWAVREMGATATSLARQLGISQPAVSMAVRRGERLARERGFTLTGE